MTSKPVPLYSTPLRKRCPVCGFASYSAEGIHPQCAAEQADAQRLARSKRSPKPMKAKTTSGLHAWQRRCRKCKAVVHVRKAVCQCGQVLSNTKRD